MINAINTGGNTYDITIGAESSPAVDTAKNTDKTAKSQEENELQEIELEETEGAAKTEEEQALDDVNNQLAKSEKQYADKIENCYKQIEQLNKQLENVDKQRRSLLDQLFAGGETASVMSGIQQINDQKASILQNVTQLLCSIESLETSLEENRIQAQESIDKINDIISQKQAAENVQTALTNTSEQIKPGMGMGDIVATLGNSFVGVINSDAEGNAAFSNGVAQHWCADFVTSIVKTACESTGKSVPSGFGSSSVSGLQSWAVSNGSFITTAGQSNKAGIISGQIKTGDIMIQKENGASHTGIVTKVYPDGSFDTVEGNSSDAVKNRHYEANSDKLTGFISMKWS